MVANRFLCDNIMIKNKTLPLFEQNGIYNLKKRKYKNIDTLHEYNIRTQVLSKNVRAGSLWDTIKNIFKKGTKIAKDAIHYIDNSPVLSTVKDIASDYIQEKTGINPNDYYNIAKDVVNMSPQQLSNTATDAAVKTMKDQYQQHKQRVAERKKNPNAKQPTKREQVKNIMTNYKDNLIKSIPEYKNVVQENFDLFSNGLDNLSAGSLNIETWKKKGPLFLLSMKGRGGKNAIDEKVKDFLKRVHHLTDFRLTPTMNSLLKIAPKLSTGEESEGRLHLGNGEELSSGKRNNEKYLKVLSSLK